MPPNAWGCSSTRFSLLKPPASVARLPQGSVGCRARPRLPARFTRASARRRAYIDRTSRSACLFLYDRGIFAGPLRRKPHQACGQKSPDRGCPTSKTLSLYFPDRGVYRLNPAGRLIAHVLSAPSIRNQQTNVAPFLRVSDYAAKWLRIPKGIARPHSARGALPAPEDGRFELNG